MEKLGLLISDVLAKKELSNLEPDFVKPKLIMFLNNHKKIKDRLESSEYEKFKRSKDHKEVVSRVRAELRTVYGVFINDEYRKRHGLLEALKEDPSVENHDNILSLHKSTQERLPIYRMVYKKIFSFTGVPKMIVDLACGLNPISYPYLGCKPEYLACDLSGKDMEFVSEYFSIMNIKGEARKIDLLKNDVSKVTAGADVTFLFKALDSLEVVEWNKSEEVLKRIKSEFIVVSFATKSIGGRKDIRPEKRLWAQRIFQKNRWEYSEFELPGEYFYVVRKA
ncbi:hypothetical protein JW826_01420 [Candidatus Woesearchaeota archaeon]|nr:hypothetical protein [Candidatus Woesearchaeota archaeon]